MKEVLFTIIAVIIGCAILLVIIPNSPIIKEEIKAKEDCESRGGVRYWPKGEGPVCLRKDVFIK